MRNTPMTGAASDGVVILDDAGRIVFASGLGLDPRVNTLILDSSWIEETKRRRLIPFILDHVTYSVLVTPLSKGHLILLSVSNSKTVTEFIRSVDFAWDIIEQLLTDPFEAMTVVDENARVAYISPIHERFFGMKPGEAVGQHVRKVIENTRLHEVVASGKAEIGAIQKMRGSERVVSRIPIKRNEKILGAIGRVMFKGPSQVEALGRRIKALEGDLAFYKRETSSLKSQDYGWEAIIGKSPAIARLRSEIIKVAPLEIPVLIRGESGTGKELVAHAIHRLSPRRDAKIVTVNAAALPATLVESELFGYEPGAFTGAATKGRAGKFEQAEGGTMFLDEIGDMPLDVQVKLLRVLQNRMVERVGGNSQKEVDFRLVSATNQDLQTLVANGGFRLDLYYRISPIILEVPPLSKRIEDIPLLAEKFLVDVAYRHGLPVPEISEQALNLLKDRSWPGNIRQLQHEIERAFAFSDRMMILAEDFSPAQQERKQPDELSSAAQKGLKTAMRDLEDEQIRIALTECRGNKKKAAQQLGISRSYLYKKLSILEH